MAKSREKRNSSLELLRIMGMFSIIIFHYAYHGGFNFNANEGNIVIIWVLTIGGKLACDIFILITGYFLIESKMNYTKLIKLGVKFSVISLILFLVAYIFRIFPLGISDIAQSFCPLIFGNWFIVYYLLICFFSPYINILLKKLDRKQLLELCFLIIVIWSFIPTFSRYFYNFGNFDTFLTMYIIGAYMRRFEGEKILTKKENIKNLCIGIMFLLIIVLLTILVYICKFGIGGILIEKELYSYFSKINSIFVVLTAIYIFKFFKNMNFYCKSINYIASSTLGVYLLYDNYCIRKYIWRVISPNINYLESDFLIVHALVKCIMVFVVCVIIDKIVEFILRRTLYKCVDNYKWNFDKIKEKFFRLTEKLLG
ncbi:MAG: acyltransferase family protein [Clostridia bacterium]|nr:acyltransferase family protein [Clostridia bacterium]